ncbi:MarR family winged helix-turn-helix transcriptional regulator [Phenylobacterium immobile]|uniref:MarR family winged helix-turn-helix transcriptional regulator n=1 Tax=Phenylobacterium immobile TaxID=21 RepID=UPI000B112DE2|nr:MarR family winged helix-turn-helix transcriptional regulator [Phenylobacterium immobile]
MESNPSVATESANDAGSAATPTEATAAPRHFRDLPQPAQRAWGGFLKAYRAVSESINRQMVAAGPLSLADYELMLYIDNAGGELRFVDLARRTLLSESRISRRIDGLEGRGQVVRRRAEDDGRATFAVMTDKGRADFEASHAALLTALEDNFLSFIPADKLDDFAALIGDIAAKGRGRMEEAEAKRPAKTKARRTRTSA